MLKNLKKILVFYLSLIILYFLPFLDGGTGFLSQILILIAPLVLFILGLATKSFNFNHLSKKLLMFLGLFLLTAGVSTFFSYSKLFSIPEFFRYLSYFLFFLIFLLTVKKENKKPILIFLFLTAIGLCFLSLWCLLPKTIKPVSGMNLIYANYGHSHLADFLLLVIPFALSLFLFFQKKKEKIILGFLSLFFLGCFLLTFSRGAFLVLPLIIALVIFLSKPKEKAKKIIARSVLFLPVIFLFLILAFSVKYAWKNKNQVLSQKWLAKQVIKPDFDANRLEYWRQAILAFKERPVLGFGPGTFELIGLRFQRQTSGWSNYTHNFYLQILSENGFFALVFFVLFLSISVKQCSFFVLKNKNDPFLIGSLGAILASVLHSFWDYDWHFPAIFLVFLLILANLLVFSTVQTKQVPKPKLLILLLFFLSLLVFLFGLSKIGGEYFLQKKDYQKALKITVWPPTQAREIGNKIFEESFPEGEKTALNLIKLSPNDPSMNFWLGDKYYYLGNNPKAAFYYQKAVDFNPVGNFILYRKLAKIYKNLGREDRAEKTYENFSLIFKSTLENGDSLMAKEAYFICLENRAVFWCSLARKALPQWSYFYLEEAALLISENKKSEAEGVLRDCLKYYWPAEHCREYLESKKENFGLEPFGRWKENISLIPAI